MTDKVVDGHGTPIVVGSLVEDEGGPYGTVISITEADADMDDDGTTIYFHPKVVVQYHDCQDQFICEWPSPYAETWVCDDVKVLVAQEAAS